MKKLSDAGHAANVQTLRDLVQRSTTSVRSRQRPDAGTASRVTVRLWLVTRWLVRTRRARYYREQWRILRP